MEEFEKIITEKIKKIQQVLIRNTADLNDEIRSKVYSKFQAVKYKFLNAQEFKTYMKCRDAFGFFAPEDNTIYFLDNDNKKNIDSVSLLHEMLHAVTSEAYNKNEPFNNTSGFKHEEVMSQGKTNIISAVGREINEAATQFFAEKFLSINGTNIYPFEVHIFSILCDECGYNAVKNAYFSSSIDQLKKVIKDGFKLKDDYLIDNLFTNMDIFGVVSDNNPNYFTGFLLMKNCYSSLLQMKLNKMMVATNFVASRNDLINNFNTDKYLMKYANPLFKGFFQSFFEDFEDNKISFLSTNKLHKIDYLTAKNYSLLFANAILDVDVNYLEDHLDYFTQNGLEIMKQFCTENIYCKKDEKTGNYLKLSSSKLINIFLGYLHNHNDKIDLSNYSDCEKYEFISLALFNKHMGKEDVYSHFYPKDLVNFINSGYYECDTFFDERAMEYIWPEIKHINPKLLYVKEFAQSYRNIMNKHLELEDSLNK